MVIRDKRIEITRVNCNCKNTVIQQCISFLGDITKFIQCDHLGHASILPCVSGLLWSQAQLACIYPINVKTGTRPGIGDMVNPCSRENILNNKLFFSHPDNSMFIQCDLWGDAYVVSCPVGRIWNQYLETCTAAHT